MTDERMQAKESREIDLIDLIIEILLHWRGLIIATLIGGLLLGGYSVYSSVKAYKAAKIATAAAEAEKAKILSDQEYFEQEKEKLESRILELENSLTAKEIGDVSLLMAYREQLKNQKDYMDNSVLMNVDPYNIPAGSVTLMIVTEQANAMILKDSYKGAFTSADMYGELKDRIGYGSEIAELVTLSDINNNTPINSNSTSVDVSPEIMVENSKDAVLIYEFKALTEDDCRGLEEAFIEYAMQKSNEYQKTVGAHELVVVDASVGTIFDSSIATKQNSALQAIGTLESNIAKGYDALSDSGKEYYDLMSKQKDAESEMAENIERAEAETVAIPPITISKKKLLIGLAGGFFVYAFIIFLAYVFSRKIKDSDDFTSSFGIDQLGRIYHECRSSKRVTGLDKAIYSLKRRGRKKISFDEASSIIALNTSFIASKAGYKKLGLITVDKEDALIGKITEALKAESVEGVVLSKPLYNGQEMSALKNVDAAVLIAKSGESRYDELWDIIEVLDNQKVEILGGIMA